LTGVQPRPTQTGLTLQGLAGTHGAPAIAKPVNAKLLIPVIRIAFSFFMCSLLFSLASLTSVKLQPGVTETGASDPVKVFLGFFTKKSKKGGLV